jgi:hypothetical protein
VCLSFASRVHPLVFVDNRNTRTSALKHISDRHARAPLLLRPPLRTQGEHGQCTKSEAGGQGHGLEARSKDRFGLRQGLADLASCVRYQVRVIIKDIGVAVLSVRIGVQTSIATIARGCTVLKL